MRLRQIIVLHPNDIYSDLPQQHPQIANLIARGLLVATPEPAPAIQAEAEPKAKLKAEAEVKKRPAALPKKRREQS
ncbi:MAG: hypothetical protein U5K75_02325 [Ahrensia sp.]|nr:hypothetical protein [Ahrensia sp.]